MRPPRRRRKANNYSLKPYSKSAKPPTLRRPRRPAGCSRILPSLGRQRLRMGAKHEPPDAVSQTLSVANSRHPDAHRASGFAGGGMVLVGDTAAPELLLDYLSRQHGAREPARRDDQD